MPRTTPQLAIATATAAILREAGGWVIGDNVNPADLGEDAIRASAEILGRAGDLEDPRYVADTDSLVVKITYSSRGAGAVYEITPDGRSVLWMN